MKDFKGRHFALAAFLTVELLLPVTSEVLAEPGMADYAMKEAILKLDVTFQKSKIDTHGTQTCQSEGTGFVVDSIHVVTAIHVFDFDPDCGTATIVAKSYADGTQVPLEVEDVDAPNDVALLKSATSLTSHYAGTGKTLKRAPCALAVSNVDEFFEKPGAIRYGIAGQLTEPTLIGTSIQSENGQFSPLVQVTPTKIERGESGGPIMMDAVVAGMIDARLDNVPNIGLMVRSSKIFGLLSRHQAASPDTGELCNVSFFSARQKRALIESTKVIIESSGSASAVKGTILFDAQTIEDTAELNSAIGVIKVAMLKSVSEGPAIKNFDFTGPNTENGSLGMVSFSVGIPTATPKLNCKSVFSQRTCSIQSTPRPAVAIKSDAKLIEEILGNGATLGTGFRDNLVIGLHSKPYAGLK